MKFVGSCSAISKIKNILILLLPKNIWIIFPDPETEEHFHELVIGGVVCVDMAKMEQQFVEFLNMLDFLNICVSPSP